jgi:hypothetical protein
LQFDTRARQHTVAGIGDAAGYACLALLGGSGQNQETYEQ